MADVCEQCGKTLSPSRLGKALDELEEALRDAERAFFGSPPPPGKSKPPAKPKRHLTVADSEERAA